MKFGDKIIFDDSGRENEYGRHEAIYIKNQRYDRVIIITRDGTLLSVDESNINS